MTRVRGADASYDVARQFSERCLQQDLSLLWPKDRAWMTANLATLIEAIASYPPTLAGSFVKKLVNDLDGQLPAVAQVAADVLVLYHMFDDWTKATTKRQQVETVAAQVASAPPDASVLDRAFLRPLGVVGTHYTAAQHREILFFLDFARRFKEDALSSKDVAACQRLADEVRGMYSGTGEARNVLLHLLFPDQFEAIASQSSKQQIVRSFASQLRLDGDSDVDETLRHIREQLTPRFGPSFSFYDETVRLLWSRSAEDALRDAIAETLSGYCQARADAPFSGTHPIFAAFHRVTQLLLASEPVKKNSHLTVRFSLGQGNWARVPWIALLDNRITTTTQTGFYCVFLYREDCSGVYLTLNQGVTQPQKELGGRRGKEWLREHAVALRSLVPELAGTGFQLDDMIDLRASGSLGQDYQGSTVAHKYYAGDDLPLSTDLLADLDAALVAYAKCVTATESAVLPPDLAAVETEFSESLEAAGLSFGHQHDQLIRTFLASVITKRFVILTGLSGSGKTQLALKLGEWLGEEHCIVIPVRPDWAGPEPLFGYEDVLRPSAPDGRQAWNVPLALEFMLKAARDASNPYVLVLDEMNLAHVERYFADFLSGMESGKPVLPNLVPDETGDWRTSVEDPAPLPIPANLFVVGTVNVDETTYLFSPKVLDRANTIEFRVMSADLNIEARKPQPLAPGDRATTQALLTVAVDDDWHLNHAHPMAVNFVDSLIRLHRMLARHHAEFGHRTFYEATRFAAVFAALGDPSWERALDLQVYQKVLPRIHGSRRRVEPLLQALGMYCLTPDTVDPAADPPDDFDILTTPVIPRLPLAFEKLRRMMRTARADQFVSFAE